MADPTNPEDNLKISDAELTCLQAAARAFDEVAPKINISGYSGQTTDNRIYARHLLADILHKKYDACVEESGLPTVPRSKAGDQQHR